MKRLFALILAALLLATSLAQADVEDFGDGAGHSGALEDNYMWSYSSWVHYNIGGSGELWVGQSSPFIGNANALFRVKFAGGSLLDSHEISAVSFFIKLKATTGGGVNPIRLYSMCPDNYEWVEGTSGGGVQAGSSDWGHTIHDSNSWDGSAGAMTKDATCAGASDYYSLLIAAGPATAANGTWLEFVFSAHGIQEVEDAVASGEFNFVFKPNTYPAATYTYFYTSEEVTDAYRPYMRITYAEPGAPEGAPLIIIRR